MAERVEVRAPVENVNDETIAIVRWLVADGDRVTHGTPLLLAETTKTSFDVVAPADGFVRKVAPDEGEVPVGAVLCYISEHEEAPDALSAAMQRNEAPAATLTTPVEAQGSLREAPSGTRFSGKALALVKALGLDVGAFAGRGLVRERDVFELASLGTGGGNPGPAALPDVSAAIDDPPTPAKAKAKAVGTHAEKLPRAKRLEAQYLRSALDKTIPSIATIAVPTKGFFSSAQRRPELVGIPGAAVIFECSRLLRKHRLFNAFHENGEIHYYDQVNIGYALDLGNGLKVPVIHDADRKSLQDIAAEKQRLVVEYINEALPVASLSGGTFTITDLSSEGVFHFNPVLNQGQSAILGVCGELFPTASAHGLFNLVLAFDHQVAEGRTAAAFLRDLRDRLIGHEEAFGVNGHAEPTQEVRCEVCLRSAAEVDEAGQFLLAVMSAKRGSGRAVCSVCLQGW